jgi:glycosyltransferase involved in cell wall biosynthesis
MKIAVYHPYPHAVGGAQRYLGAVAATLTRGGHAVDLVHHCPGFDPAAVGEALEVDLSGVAMRHIPRPERPEWPPAKLLQRYRRERDWGREVSAGYDVFVNSSEGVPLFCHARRGVLITHFPLVRFAEFHAETGPAWRSQPPWRRAASRLYHRLEWRRRFAGYQLCLTNSEYSRQWLRRLWGVQAVVLYPPVRAGLTPGRKEPLILTVAAFHHARHKRHEAALKAFRDLCDAGLSGWRYVMAGACGAVAADVCYLARLRSQAEGYPVDVRTNLGGAELKGLLESASLLWHPMGYGVDAEREPGLMEHFGMVVSEAMAAGCVPVVFDGGGLPESVRHGETGYLWRTLEQLGACTSGLVRDEALRGRMARAAMRRAEEFPRERFEQRLLAALGKVLR